jgi:hypothetical protein
MKTHFIKDHETNKWYHTTIFILTTILTFGLGMFLFYDVLMIRHYYINRKRLIKYLNDKSNELTMINSFVGIQFMDDITDYHLTIDGTTYKIWLWTKVDGSSKVTLGSENSASADYIGLFISTPTCKRLNNEIVDILNKKTPELFGH